MELDLLKEMCTIPGVSGDEAEISNFVLEYINRNKHTWKSDPFVFSGNEFQDCIVLVFGKPTTAVFAHIDTIGFTVGYNKELIKIGGPSCDEGAVLFGSDSKSEVECEYLQFEHEDGSVRREYVFDREIERGTNLSYKSIWRETDDYIESCYMDNRLGVWTALKLAESLENGAIVFSCYEEHGGGTVGFLADFLYNKYSIKQALIADITWVTEGVEHGKGVALSMRDSGIPRRSYINKIIALAQQSDIPFQLEVESAGGSDGNALQRSPYPFDWMFIGAPEDHVHSPDEKVHKKDIEAMLMMYQYLMENLH